MWAISARDSSQPDGTPKKQLDVSRLAALGWRARIPLAEDLLDLLRPQGTHWNHVDPVVAAVAIPLAADHGEKGR